MSIIIPVRKGEAVDKALRRLKKRLDREGILRDVRDKRYFEKPCLKRRRKEKIAKFTNFLRLRNENM
ncbi:MAG: 30S ribosomal protein S21 [Puniceicoccales bacterium]|jgi:small subunit ribosomal protein S21|nr:30S ribosomal protein S21 [Puniceicoccales bacterium]